jgi:hypothetical protein
MIWRWLYDYRSYPPTTLTNYSVTIPRDIHPWAHLTAPPVEDNECDLELALTSSQLPADLFDEQAMEELNRRKEGRPSVEGTLA